MTETPIMNLCTEHMPWAQGNPYELATKTHCEVCRQQRRESPAAPLWNGCAIIMGLVVFFMLVILPLMAILAMFGVGQ